MTTPAACVIAQQHSSATFVSLHFHTRMEKNRSSLENRWLINFFTFHDIS
jgi:general stress protein 26